MNLFSGLKGEHYRHWQHNFLCEAYEHAEIAASEADYHMTEKEREEFIQKYLESRGVK